MNKNEGYGYDVTKRIEIYNLRIYFNSDGTGSNETEPLYEHVYKTD